MNNHSISKLNFTPEELQDLGAQYATILCLDVPYGFEFGIDCASWRVGEHFKGVRFVPSGVHYLHCTGVVGESSLDSKESTLPRTGFWLHSKPGHVYVYKFNTVIEELDACVDVNELERYAEGVRRGDFLMSLGAYPLENWTSWTDLTSLISPSILSLTSLSVLQLDPAWVTANPQFMESSTTQCVPLSFGMPLDESSRADVLPRLRAQAAEIAAARAVVCVSSAPAERGGQPDGGQDAADVAPPPHRRALPHERELAEESLLSGRPRYRFLRVPLLSGDGLADGVAGLSQAELTARMFSRSWALASLLAASHAKYGSVAGPMRLHGGTHGAESPHGSLCACPASSSSVASPCLCLLAPAAPRRPSPLQRALLLQADLAGARADAHRQLLASAAGTAAARPARGAWVEEVLDGEDEAEAPRADSAVTRELALARALLRAPAPASAPADASPRALLEAAAAAEDPLPWPLVLLLPSPALPLLAELQLAFAALLVGQRHEGLAHWKRLLDTCCRSDHAFDYDPPHALQGPRAAPLGGRLHGQCLFFAQLLAVLHRQLAALPADLFQDLLLRDSFLRAALAQLRLLLAPVLAPPLLEALVAREEAEAEAAGEDLCRGFFPSMMPAGFRHALEARGPGDAPAAASASVSASDARVGAALCWGRHWCPVTARTQWVYLAWSWRAVEALLESRFGVCLDEEDDEGPMLAAEDGGF